VRRGLLLGGGLGLVGACLSLARIENLVEAPRMFLGLFGAAFACYGVALWALIRLRGRRALLIVLIVAMLCRLALLWAPPTLSTDAYRYVWDARVASAGISPYLAPPSAPELARLHDATIYPRLNHPTWRTIYPPGAQIFFRAVYRWAPDSVLAMKMAIALAELATLTVLASLLRALGVPLVQLAVYAWNPLVLTEIWGSGHLDALVMLSAVTAVRLAVAGRLNVAAALLGLGTLVKLYPAALLLLLLDDVVVGPLVTFALVVLVGYAPFAHLGLGALGSLPQYVASEFYNPGLVRTFIDAPAVTFVALAAWVAFAALGSRGASLIDRAVVVIAGSILMSPNIFPWYVLWLVPFLAIRPSVPWIAFTGTVALAYAFFLHEPWAIPAWARVAEFLPLAIGAGWALGRSWMPDRASPEAGLASRPVAEGTSDAILRRHR
jgi:alpha-1,6-mannosyltransferase